jgi:ketol-acid reductoisomerase
MNYSVSDTAEYGGYTRGPRVITGETKKEMKKILEEIQNGKFAEEWINENKNGRPNMNKLREQTQNHLIEEVGKKLRSMMSWLGQNKQKSEEVDI